jgi:hypothetical protein
MPISREGPAIADYAYCGAFLIGRVLHTGAYLGARWMLRRDAAATPLHPS